MTPIRKSSAQFAGSTSLTEVIDMHAGKNIPQAGNSRKTSPSVSALMYAGKRLGLVSGGNGAKLLCDWGKVKQL